MYCKDKTKYYFIPMLLRIMFIQYLQFTYVQI